jgi:adenosylmethionine-8-amino-7-oxononanoate aminotransferase
MTQVATLLRPYAVPGRAPALRVARGEASTVFDESGRRYLDAAGGLWNVTVGLGHSALIETMRVQAEKLAYAGLFDGGHAISELLAERLVELSGGRMRHAYLSTTGSAAVEVALRVARIHFRATGRPLKRRVISFDRGYHGCSWMNLSASGIMDAEMAGWEERLPDFTTITGPACEEQSLAEIRALRPEADSIACMLIEPILGSGGIIVPSQAYCRELTSLCRDMDILLIADEVATAGGRCGAMFASDLVGLTPDIIALSKGLTSGYFPVGATLFAASVIEPFERANAPLLFGSTQDGNPIGCAAALAILDITASDGLCERAAELGRRVHDALAPLAGAGVLNEVRGLGLMIGIELAHCREGRPLFTEAEAAEVRRMCLDEGLLVYHFDSGISLYPALTISDEEVDDMIDTIITVLAVLA